MISNEMKIRKSKTAIKHLVYLSAFYLVICIAAIIDMLLVRPNEEITILSAPMIFMYILTVASISILSYNVVRLNNLEMIRRKAIRDYDERNYVVQERTNTLTLRFICFILVFGLLLSLYFNSVELFAFCFILILLIMFFHLIMKIIVNKKI